MVLFAYKQEYSLMLVCNFCSVGYGDPIFHEKWQCKGVNYPKIRVARGVLFMDNTPRDMDNIGKNAGFLLFILICTISVGAVLVREGQCVKVK